MPLEGRGDKGSGRPLLGVFAALGLASGLCCYARQRA
jgi:hypothetical protein